MIRLACIAALAGSPVVAATCPEYVDLMRAEGIRTLVDTECISAADAATLDGHWNEILAGPYGSCLVARVMSGDPRTTAFGVYMDDMNRQRAAAGCPSERQ